MDRRDDLGEEVAGVRLLQPPPRPHVGVEVGVGGREEEVGARRRRDDLADGVDVRVALNAVVRRQQRLAPRVARDGLKGKEKSPLLFGK